MVSASDGGVDEMRSSKPLSTVDSICVIGAGPSGLAVAKYLVAENAFSKIKIFEQRARVGGLWNYSPPFDEAPDRQNVPQTNPHASQDVPIWTHGRVPGIRADHGADVPVFMSPVYDNLETNIPRELMGFSDLDWPDQCQLFPRHETVLDYLEQYATDVLHLINLETQVLDVRLDENGKWLVETQRLSPDANPPRRNWTFDAVVVANGHFNVTYTPPVAGIEEWNRTYPGSILHSKLYRHPNNFTDLKVIVVGNSASGVDIASQVATTCKLPLIQSQKSESFLQPDQSSAKSEKLEIVEYVTKDRQVRFADGSVEADVDAVIYCTGYFYSFPFLDSLSPPVVTHGEHVENLYQHIFYRSQPSLSFVALNQKIIPFPVAEAQSAVIARVLSGRLNLPSSGEMERWGLDTLKDTGGGRNFHVLKFPKDADYINMLHDWAISADQEDGDEHKELRRRRLSSSHSDQTRGQQKLLRLHGKEPPYWGEKEYWTRERFPAIKKAFQIFGDNRRFQQSLEDVGFDFARWKRERIEEARTLL